MQIIHSSFYFLIFLTFTFVFSTKILKRSEDINKARQENRRILASQDVDTDDEDAVDHSGDDEFVLHDWSKCFNITSLCVLYLFYLLFRRW